MTEPAIMDDLTPPNDLPGLTAARGWLAWWVVLLHAQALATTLDPRFGFLEPLAAAGYIAVDGFFLLSGFVLAHVYGGTIRLERAPIAAFLRARVARIYPAHLAVLLLLVVMVAGAEVVHATINAPERYDTGSLLRSIFLVQAWTWPIQPNWNTPAWTVSLEWLAYLVAPLLLVAMRRRPGTWPDIVLASGLLLVPAVVVAILQNRDESAAGIVRILFEFPAGILLYRFWAHQRETMALQHLATPRGLGLMTLVLVVSATAMQTMLGSALWAVALFVPLMLGLATAEPREGRRGRWEAFMGHTSYSLYLIHYPLLLVLGRLLPAVADILPRVWHSALVPLMFLVLFIGAVVLYLGVERPARQWIRGTPVHHSRPPILRRPRTPLADGGE